MLLLFTKGIVHKKIVVLLYYTKKPYFGMSGSCLEEGNVWKKMKDVSHTESSVGPECSGSALCFHAEE